MRYTAEVQNKVAQNVLQEEVMEWQPIETAPKDGTRVLLWEKEDSDHEFIGGAVTGFFDPELVDDDFLSTWWDVSGSSELFPSHWMPLPGPPKGNDS